MTTYSYSYAERGLNGTELARLVAAAKRERAQYVAALLRALYVRVVGFAGGIRETAVACTAARLRHT